VLHAWAPLADGLLALWAHVMELPLVCMLVPSDYISAAPDARIRALHGLHSRLNVVQGLPYSADGTRRMWLIVASSARLLLSIRRRHPLSVASVFI